MRAHRKAQGTSAVITAGASTTGAAAQPLAWARGIGARDARSRYVAVVPYGDDDRAAAYLAGYHAEKAGASAAPSHEVLAAAWRLGAAHAKNGAAEDQALAVMLDAVADAYTAGRQHRARHSDQL